MKPKYTLIAAAVLVGLAAYTFMFERGEKPKEGQLLRYGVEDATHIELTRGEETIVMDKQGDDWVLTQPATGVAAADAVKRILENVARFAPKATRSGEDLAAEAYGLEKPVVVAKVTFGSTTVELSIGAEAVSGEFYAKLSDDSRLFTVPASVKSDFEKKADDLRERDVAKFDMKDISEVSLVRADQTIRLVNKPEKPAEGNTPPPSNWRIVEPVEAKADNSLVDTLARTISNLRVDQFVDDAPPGGDEEMGLSAPRLTAAVKLKNGKEISVAFGAEIEKPKDDTTTPKPPETGTSTPPTTPEKQLYVRRAGRAETYLVKATVLKDVDKALSDLRNKQLVDVTVSDVTSFSLQRREGASFTGSKTGDKWQVSAGGAETIEADTMNAENLLYDVKDLRAASFVDDVDPAESGLDAPAITIELKVKGGGQPVRVLVGNKKGSQYYARVGDDPQVMLVDATKIDGLHDALDDFKKSETKPAGDEGMLGDDVPTTSE